MNRNVLRTVSVVVLSGVLLSGCIGSFSLTNKVLGWNKSASEERWINEGIFLAFLIIPVYSLSLLGDALIFNSIEWWTDDNPVAAGTTREVKGQDGSVARLTMRADGAIDVAVTAAGGQRSEFMLVRDGAEVSARDRDGQRLDVVTF